MGTVQKSPGGKAKSQRGKRGLRLLRILAAAFLCVLGMMVVAPLALRGPVVRWAVARATAGLCGSFTLGGGHVGWDSAFRLVSGRPIQVVLADVRITGPDGQVVFAAHRLEATARVDFSPFQLTVPTALVAQGQWRLFSPANAIGSDAAFRAVPAGGRSACLVPAPPVSHPSSHAPSGASSAGGSLSVGRVKLQDVDVGLDFSSWGLVLSHVQATGSLALGGTGPPLLFDTRHATAAGGSLRVGFPGGAWTAQVPFDAVVIGRVAVVPDKPTDLLLEVDGAQTGPARLAGRADFHNIFPGPSGSQPLPAGLSADIRWSSLGGALAKMDASWRPRAAWIRLLDGDLSAKVEGPFFDLMGSLHIEGRELQVLAHLDASAADLMVQLRKVDTTWMLDPALRPFLGGHLHGHLYAVAHLAPSLAGTDAEITEADLHLDRDEASLGPRRYDLRIGNSDASATDVHTMAGIISGVRLAGAKLRLDGMRLAWKGLSARARLEIAFPEALPDEPPPGRRGSPTRVRLVNPVAVSGQSRAGARTHIDAEGALDVAALESWIPGGVVRGPLRVSARLVGTLDKLELGLTFPRSSRLGIFEQTFLLPTHVDLDWQPPAMVRLATVRVKHVGGGDVDFAGMLGSDETLGATAHLRDFPVKDLPGLDRLRVPGTLDGRLGADLTLAGTLHQPKVQGRIGIARLALQQKRIGDAEVKLHLGGDHGVVEATIDPGMLMVAHIWRRPALAIDAKVSMQDRSLAPWLPPPLAHRPISASGTARVVYKEGAPVEVDGDFAMAGPGLDNVKLGGSKHGQDTRLHLRGDVDVAAWPIFWSHYLSSAAGIVNLDVTVEPDPTRADGTMRPSGTMTIARDLVVRMPRWPSPITLPAAGRIQLDGDNVTTSGLSVATRGLSGRIAGTVELDGSNLQRSRVALDLDARLDAARIPLRLPAGLVAQGQASMAVRWTGTLDQAPGPGLHGHVSFDNLVLQAPPGHASYLSLSSLRVGGVIKADGDVLSTEGLHLTIGGVGDVTVGRPSLAAQAQLLSLWPLRFGRVDVPVAGANLTVGGPSSPLTIGDLDADLRLLGNVRGSLKLEGDIAVAQGKLAPSRVHSHGPGKKGGDKWYRALPPNLTLDLWLRGSRKALRVAVPILPDVTVDFQCHLLATQQGATLDGRLRGDSLYAKAAVHLYDWFTPGDLRRCQLP